MASFTLPISQLVDPVPIVLAAIGVGLWLSRRRGGAGAATRAARIGRGAAWGGWLALWLLATPVVSSALARSIATRPRDISADLEGSAPERRALVVLSAGAAPPELGVPRMERLSGAAMDRCIGAARIYQTYGFEWVIVTGRHAQLAPAELAGGMGDLMVALGVPRERILLETEATDTKENALFTARMVRELGAEQVVLVTSALHMPRALRWFERAGIRAIPAPVKLDPIAAVRPGGLLPTSTALSRSDRVLHEIVGWLEP